MPSDLMGPFDLELDVIEANVVRRGPGIFHLGHNDIWGQLSVRFVGRSDTDLKNELRNQAMKKKYTRFAFQLCDTARQAYEKSCRDYHKYRGNGYLDNMKHPYIPFRHEYQCPVCKQVYHAPSSIRKSSTDTQKRKVHSAVQLEDEALAVQHEYKPWELDEDGTPLRIGSSGEMKPWMFDDPDLEPLEDVLSNNGNDNETGDAVPVEHPLPKWLAEEDDEAGAAPADTARDTTTKAAPDTPAKKPWEVDE